MPTIGDTLTDIDRFQERVSQADSDSWFSEQLLNFTTVLFFEFSSHALLEGARVAEVTQSDLFYKYHRLSENQTLKSEFVRLNSIGHLFVAWIAYEKYLRDRYLEITGLAEFKISKLFNKLLTVLELESCDELSNEFNVIRNTRNSLHDGGIYNSEFSYFEAVLKGTTYIFEPGKPVVPLRAIDVCDVMFSHYLKLERIE